MTKPSLIRRIEAFFRDNPGETLTLEDIRTKFGASVWAASHYTRALVRSGRLVETPRQFSARLHTPINHQGEGT